MNTHDLKAPSANADDYLFGNQACGKNQQKCPSQEDTKVSDTSDKVNKEEHVRKRFGFPPRGNKVSEAQAEVKTKETKETVAKDPEAAAERVKKAMRTQGARGAQKKAGKYKLEWKKVTHGGVAGVVLGTTAIAISTPASAIVNDTTGPISYDDLIVDNDTDGGFSSIEAMVNPKISLASGVNNDMSFSKAFSCARAEVGPGGVFQWRGQLYGTYTAQEWDNLSEEERLDFTNHFSMPVDEVVPEMDTDSDPIYDHNSHSRMEFAQTTNPSEAKISEAELFEAEEDLAQDTVDTIGYQIESQTYYADNLGEGSEDQKIVEPFNEDEHNTIQMAQNTGVEVDTPLEAPEIEVFIENNDEVSANLFASVDAPNPMAGDSVESLNAETSYNDLAEAEVEVLGVYQDEATGMTIGGMNINGQEVLLIDVENDGEFDIAAIDFNSNGKVDIGEIVDIADLNMDDPMLSQSDDANLGIQADDILDSGLDNDDSFLV